MGAINTHSSTGPHTPRHTPPGTPSTLPSTQSPGLGAESRTWKRRCHPVSWGRESTPGLGVRVEGSLQMGPGMSVGEGCLLPVPWPPWVQGGAGPPPTHTHTEEAGKGRCSPGWWGRAGLSPAVLTCCHHGHGGGASMPLPILHGQVQAWLERVPADPGPIHGRAPELGAEECGRSPPPSSRACLLRAAWGSGSGPGAMGAGEPASTVGFLSPTAAWVGGRGGQGGALLGVRGRAWDQLWEDRRPCGWRAPKKAAQNLWGVGWQQGFHIWLKDSGGAGRGPGLDSTRLRLTC